MPASAQDDGAWNAERALELAARAQETRTLRHAEDGLASYRALANGYIHFYLDLAESDREALVKVDQTALEVYWAAPDLAKQRLIGLRDESPLPNRQNYHLDHFMVVQDEFGDVIRLGDGDEVADVPHPAAAGVEAVYDYRLADSLSLRLPGASEEVRVYELEVRPRNVERSGFVGSMFVDRASARIVRMSFTFTPASYIDPRLEYIRVSLENGLWDGRYWLPHEQRLEIRRQVPELDFGFGTVIRAVARIGDYRFNEDLPSSLFDGRALTMAPRAEREAYAFPTDIYAEIDATGLASPGEIEALQRQAVRLLARRRVNGYPRLRLHVPNASSALRYNRAEGLFLGAGLAYRPESGVQAQGRAGYAFGAGHATFLASLQHEPIAAHRLRVRGYRYAPLDMGVRPGAAGALNTLMSATAGVDRLDLFYAHGGGIEIARRVGDQWRATLALDLQEHRSASLEATAAAFAGPDAFRPVRAIDEGRWTGGRLRVQRDDAGLAAFGWTAEVDLETASFAGDWYARSSAQAGLARRSADRRSEIELRGSAGTTLGPVPPQRLFLLGGDATLPGHAYRSYAGTHFALAELEASREVYRPWLRLRALAAAGWTALDDRSSPPAQWGVSATGSPRASVALGAGLFYDILRFDLARGLNGGGWRGVLSVNPQLTDIL